MVLEGVFIILIILSYFTLMPSCIFSKENLFNFPHLILLHKYIFNLQKEEKKHLLVATYNRILA